MEIESVIERIQEDSEGKRDVTATSLRLTDDGLLEVYHGSEWELMKMNRHATTQLFQKFEMPSKYFSRLIVDDPELTAYHFNKIAQAVAPEDLLVRTKMGMHTEDEVTEDSGNLPVVRGIMSDLYSVLDNDMVIDGLQSVIGKFSNEYDVVDSFLDDRRMHLRITFPSTSRQFGFTKDDVGDILQVGIDIVNSEVGVSSMNIGGLVWRLVCANGLRKMLRGESFIQRHMYLDTPSFYNNMSFAMTQGIQSGIDTMKNFSDSKRIELIRPLQIMKVIGEHFDIPNAVVELAQERWEHDATVYGIINSFTASARGMTNENRLDLERVSGRMLSLTPKEWSKFDRIAEEYD